MPVFFINGKLYPCLERSYFVHTRYDKSEVVEDGLLVCVQYTSALSLVVKICGKNCWWQFGCQNCVSLLQSKVRCCVAICFLMLGISNNLFLTASSVMRFCFTSITLMPSMGRML